MERIIFTARECIYVWPVKYTKDNSVITVKIKIINKDNLEKNEIDILKERWRGGILKKWNFSDTVRFDINWVESEEDCIVYVRKERGIPSNVFNWDNKDDENVASHEFGHLLGLPDEYINRDQCPDRNPVNTGSVMDRPSGPALQRHINGLLNRLPAEPQKSAAEVYMDKIDTEDFYVSNGKYTISLSGGIPGAFVEEKIIINEFDKKITYSTKNEKSRLSLLKQFNIISDHGLKEIKSLIAKGAVYEAEHEERFILPDSLIAKITVEVSGKTQTVILPLEEAAFPREPSGKAWQGELLLNTQPVINSSLMKELYSIMANEINAASETSIPAGRLRVDDFFNQDILPEEPETAPSVVDCAELIGEVRMSPHAPQKSIWLTVSGGGEDKVVFEISRADLLDIVPVADGLKKVLIRKQAVVDGTVSSTQVTVRHTIHTASIDESETALPEEDNRGDIEQEIRDKFPGGHVLITGEHIEPASANAKALLYVPDIIRWALEHKGINILKGDIEVGHRTVKNWRRVKKPWPASGYWNIPLPNTFIGYAGWKP